MGNPVSYLGQTLTWEGKQLTAAGTNTYAYDENGLRTQKTTGSGTTDYFYNGSVLMGLTKGNDTLLFSYDQRGKVQAVRFNGTYYYYLRNGQGDIIKLIDNDGNTAVAYAYDTWGKQLSCTGTLASTLGVLNPFRYRGYVYDEETQWYYLQSRYYDPETCRFLSADIMLSTGQGVLGHNTFAYCLNNPAKYYDNCGTKPISIDDDDDASNDFLDDAAGGPTGGGARVSSNNLYSRGSFGGNYGSFGNPNRAFSQHNFRKNLQECTGQSGEGLDAHHIFPQTFRKPFTQIEIKIHQYGVWWEAHDHKTNAYSYNQEWRVFLKENPTCEEAFAFANKLAKQFGYYIDLKP